VSCASLTFRRPIAEDHDRVIGVIAEWWGGRDLRTLLPGEHEVDGIPVAREPGPHGDWLVHFALPLGDGDAR
jgi:hypothetical protein